jgi:hypothetical protein
MKHTASGKLFVAFDGLPEIEIEIGIHRTESIGKCSPARFG